MVAVLLQALFGWWQFANGLWINQDELGSRTRPFGVFQQVNVMASFMATGLVLSLYLLSKSDAKRWRWIETLYVLTPLLTIHILHTLTSRTGWLGAVVGVLFVCGYAWKSGKRKKIAIWIGAALLGLGASFYVIPNTGWTVVEKEIISLQSVRAWTMPQTVDMFLDKPLTGFGYGNFEKSYLEFTASEHAEDPSSRAGYPSLSHPHNELLLWAAEGGIIALLALLAMAYFVWSRVQVQEIWTRLALIGLFFPIVLHTQLELPFYQSVAHAVIFVILIFWVDNLSAEYKTKQLKTSILVGAAAIAIPLATTAFMVTTLQSGLLLSKYETRQLEFVGDLGKMMNPVVWQDRLNWTIRSRLLVNGILSGQPELAQGYVDWAPAVIEREPRVLFYQYLILGHEALGNDAKVEEITKQAYYLFPDESFELDHIASIISRPIAVSPEPS